MHRAFLKPSEDQLKVVSSPVCTFTTKVPQANALSCVCFSSSCVHRYPKKSSLQHVVICAFTVFSHPWTQCCLCVPKAVTCS